MKSTETYSTIVQDITMIDADPSYGSAELTKWLAEKGAGGLFRRHSEHCLQRLFDYLGRDHALEFLRIIQPRRKRDACGLQEFSPDAKA